ncbi:MAG: mercuric ion binding protein [Flavobacteriales bacterium]|jgi:mercuric ion binding protein
MKSIVLSLTMALFLASSFTTVYAESTIITNGVKGIVVAESFKVYGNCDMCAVNIETAALSLKGVKKAEWDKETKMLEVIFNTGKVTLDEIKKKIAMAGYDTKEVKSTDENYSKLAGCCKYERPKNE